MAGEQMKAPARCGGATGVEGRYASAPGLPKVAQKGEAGKADTVSLREAKLRALGVPAIRAPLLAGLVWGGAMTDTQDRAVIALEYAARGWHVFPINQRTGDIYQSKRNSGGRRWGETCDPAEIRSAWQRWPGANIGIACEESGLVVLDLDRKNGADGVEWLVGQTKENGEVLHTLVAKTPSGGLHYYFTAPAGIELKTCAGEITPGVDVRAWGGYAVAPGSEKAGGVYQWENPPPLFEAAEIPAWLLEQMPRRGEAKPLREGGGAGFIIDTGRNSPAWAEAAVRGEVSQLWAASAGERNSRLNAAAFAVGQVAHHLANPEGAKDKLRQAAIGIGLESGEIEATLKSGFEAGRQKPRDPAGGMNRHHLPEAELAHLPAWRREALGLSLSAPEPIPYLLEGLQPLVREIPPGAPFPLHALGRCKRRWRRCRA